MTKIANDLNITVHEVIDHLQQLKFSGEISFELKDPAYCYVILKKPDDLNTLSANITKWLSEVESSKVHCKSFCCLLNPNVPLYSINSDLFVSCPNVS
jgi:predicted transcriptional regulator